MRLGSRSGFPRNPRKYQGGWLNVAVAGVSALLSRRSGKAAQRAANEARARELEIQQGHLDLARRQDERGSELFAHYRDHFMPREQRFIDDAFDRPISPIQAEASAVSDVRSSLETARGMQERNQRRLGVNPASGTALALDRMTSLEEAKLEAGAKTRAREGVRDLNFARQGAALELGRGVPSVAGGFSGQALSGFGTQASLATARRRDADDLAFAAGQATGSAIGEFMDAGVELWRGRKASKAGAEG